VVIKKFFDAVQTADKFTAVDKFENHPASWREVDAPEITDHAGDCDRFRSRRNAVLPVATVGVDGS